MPYPWRALTGRASARQGREYCIKIHHNRSTYELADTVKRVDAGRVPISNNEGPPVTTEIIANTETLTEEVHHNEHIS